MPDMSVQEGLGTNPAEDKKRIKEEKKRLKAEMKQQRKEVKVRDKELSKQAADLDAESEGSTASVVVVTTLIVLVWLAILIVVIKLDVGGFGSTVLTPILKDVPVVNKILPNTESPVEEVEEDSYSGYKSIEEAVEQIKYLEIELEKAKSGTNADAEEVAGLKAEVKRLKTFETNQVNFDLLKTKFYKEVVYSEKGPGIEEYRAYYEEIDPTTAEYLYKEVIKDEQVDAEVEDFVKAYSSSGMKPKEAAAIFEAMTDNLERVAKILNALPAADRGAILGKMDPTVAAKVTKIMDPNN